MSPHVLQSVLHTHTIKILNTILKYLSIWLQPIFLTFAFYCITILPPFKCIAHIFLWRCSWLLLMQCSYCALHLTFLPSPPPIPLHFHWLNLTLLSRMISEDFNIFNTPFSHYFSYSGYMSMYWCILLPLYRMNCLQARTICYICFSLYNSNRRQLEGICWIQRCLGGGKRKTFMYPWFNSCCFPPIFRIIMLGQ